MFALAGLVVVGLACLAAQAKAQVLREDSLVDVAAQGGNWGTGITLRGYELSPSVSAELGYDSNFFQSSGLVGVTNVEPGSEPVADGATLGDGTGRFVEPVVGTFRMRIQPALLLEPSSERSSSLQRRIDVRASASVGFNELVSMEGEFSEAVREQRYLSAEVGAEMRILPKRPWSGVVSAEYIRSVQPVNDPTAPPAYKISTVNGGASLRWQPGGGLLNWQFGYKASAVLFEEPLYRGFNSIRHDALLQGNWMFLPRTSLFYRGSVGVLTFPNGSTVKPQGTPLASRVGLTGLITRRVRVRLAAGYKAIFFESGEDADSVVGDAEVTYSPSGASPGALTGLSAISVGYARDTQPAFLGNFFDSDRFYLRGVYAIASVLQVRGEAGLSHLSRPESFFENGTRQTAAFGENRLNVGAEGRYTLTDALGATLSLKYSSALTDRQVALAIDEPAGTLPYDDLSFNRFEAWAGVSWSP